MHLLASAAIVLLAGCSLAPEFIQPALEVPAAYKESSPASGDWKPAEPQDAAARGEWWQIFNDPVLNDLETEAIARNQSLQAAAARVQQTRALLGVARAERSPQVGAGAAAARVQPSGVQAGLPGNTGIDPYNVYRTTLTASYEVDLFGRIKDSVRAAGEDLAADEANYHSLLLSLQADVAQSYFSLRQTDAELAVVRATVATRAESVRLLQRRFDVGDISELDLARARTELETSRSDAFALERQRAQLEHALAILLGRAPASFAVAPAALVADLPQIPPGLPSVLLERRPDIAAAQRRMTAANARIGIAKAAFYPVLNLTAGFGLESGELGDLFEWSSRIWALGPAAGSLLAMPLIDGGRKQANLDRAYAQLDAEIADYRQTVLSAFGEVEDTLSGLRTLAGQASAIADSLAAAELALKIAMKRYNAGATGYLDVLDAERTLIDVQRLDTQIKGARATTSVALVRALGGGWVPGL